MWEDKVKENIVLIFNDVKVKRYFAPNLMNQNSLYIAFLGCMMGWNSLYKENFHHLIFLSYFVYNVNKMQDLYLKITFIIVWIVFKYKNNDE